MSPDPYAAAVAGWAADLRVGRTVTWGEWLAGEHPAEHAEVPAGVGAAQLELVRRLALAGPLGGFADLADLVLGTPATGRGRVDVPLPWRDHPPVAAPEDLPAGELQRVATGVLARLLPATSATPDQRARERFFARRFRAHGSPATAAALRGRLRGAGWVDGTYRAVHVVVAVPLEVMVRELWVTQVRSGSGRSWRRLWRMLQAADRLPPRLDVAAAAERLHSAGARVEVVVAPTPTETIDAAATLLDVRASGASTAEPDPVVLEVRRRLNVVLGAAAVPAALDALEDWCAPEPARPLAVPSAQRDWLARRADDLADRLRFGNYPVHGDPADVTRVLGGEVRRGIDPDDTLATTLQAIRTGWQLRQQAQEVD